MKLVNIIVTYNRLEKLSECFENLKKFNWTDVILIDNNSSCDLDPLLKKYQKEINIKYHKLSENIGASGGFNFGIRQFCKHFNDNDFAIIHDDDAWPIFSPDKLIKRYKNMPKIFCLPVINKVGVINKMNTPGVANFLLNPFKIFTQKRKINYERSNEDTVVDYASFVGLGINKKIFLKYGLPNKNFFIYSDDTFYTLGLTRSGESIKAIKDLSFSFIHDCNRSTGKTLIEGRFGKFEIGNKILLLRKFSKWPKLFIFLFILKSISLSIKNSNTILEVAFNATKINLKEFENDKI